MNIFINVKRIVSKVETMVKAKQFILASNFQGMPKPSDFKIEEVSLPDLQTGEFLSQAVFWSVDPYMRAYSAFKRAPYPMFGLQIAKVIETKNPKFPVGSYISANAGWTTHTVHNLGNDEEKGTIEFPTYKVEEIPGHPLSLYLGILGMPGNTAYFGFTETCKPKKGETVVISGAGGAVGNHVGQIAKILGLKVIGITGSDEKGEWLKTTGFDDFVNYKKDTWYEDLKKKAPNGVDCYFDNVGGDISSAVLNLMNKRGRVAVCGSISSYNATGEYPKAPILQPAIVMKILKIEGLHASEYMDRWEAGIKQNAQWLKEGKLTNKETVYEGFENIPNALIGILNGDNTGKAVVKA